MEKKYICIRDLQGGEFAVGNSMTVGEWRGQAIEWAENDNTEETIEELENLKENEVMDYIREVWELEIVESNDFAENILFYYRLRGFYDFLYFSYILYDCFCSYNAFPAVGQ